MQSHFLRFIGFLKDKAAIHIIKIIMEIFMQKFGKIVFLIGLVCLGWGFAGEAKDNLPLKISDQWNVFLNVVAPKEYGVIPTFLKNADNNEVASQLLTVKKGYLDFKWLDKLSAETSGHCAVIYNEFVAASDGVMKIGAAADWWMEIYVNGNVVYSTMKNGNGISKYIPEAHVFTFPVKKGKNILAVKIIGGSAGWKFVYGVPKPKQPDIVYKENDEWKIVRNMTPNISKGSALDLSAVSNITGGKQLPRLFIGSEGRLTGKIDGKDTQIRLRGFGINVPWVLGRAEKNDKWKDQWRNWLDYTRMLGYNFIRVGYSASGSIDSERWPGIVDKADYLLSEMGKRGIYTFLTASGKVYYKNPWGTLSEGERRDFCLRMFMGDSEVRQLWKGGITYLLTHVNPYNGIAWKDDPGIAVLELYNEQIWGFIRLSANSPKTLAEYNVKYQGWLKEKYKVIDELNMKWKNAGYKDFSDIKVPAVFPSSGTKVSDQDYLLFTSDLMHENAQWMTDVVRSAGYKGLIAQYNIARWLDGAETRYEKSQVAIANAYHCHPTAFAKKGSRIGQESSITGAAAYWRAISATRFADRPFVQTEFNHSFWNSYQHEGGIVFGAYSALQGFDALIIHAGAAFYQKEKPVDAFNVGRSPVLRANEFLSGCLFLRKDISVSPHRIQLNISKEYLDSGCNRGASISGEQTRFALLSGFSVAFPWAKIPEGVATLKKANLEMPPIGSSGFKSAGGGWAIDSVESAKGDFSFDEAISNMKSLGILSKNNISSYRNGIFQSDTEEITMKTKEKLLKVNTSRTEAVTLEKNVSEKIGDLIVNGSSIPAMIAVCSVDGLDLKDCTRMVLIYNTEVVNSGMVLSADKSEMVALGVQPVLMRVGKFSATLASSQAAKMSLYALGYDGSRREKLPLAVVGGKLAIAIDTATLKDGPTPFFEIVKE